MVKANGQIWPECRGHTPNLDFHNFKCGHPRALHFVNPGLPQLPHCLYQRFLTHDPRAECGPSRIRMRPTMLNVIVLCVEHN